MGERVEFPAGDATTGGYLAPAIGGAGLGLLVIPDSSGPVPHIADVCDRFAAEGFTALAPDPGPSGPLSGATGSGTSVQDLGGAVDHLAGHAAVRGDGLGVVGFGTGGGLALWLATLRPDVVRVVVPFYGTPGDHDPDWSMFGGAVEGHFAEHDDAAGFEVARRLETTLTDLGKEVRIFLYPNTSHGFFDDTRADVHDHDAARQAWVRTLEFLRAKLG